MPLSQDYTFTNVTEIVSAAAQTQILAQCDVMKSLIPNPAAGVSALSPDFDEIGPDTAIKLRRALDQLKAAIDAAPTA